MSKYNSIVLYHVGTKLPNHLYDCIKKIKSYSNIPIYLLTDDLTSIIDGIIICNIKNYQDLEWLKKLSYFSYDSMKEMWRGSCFRFFYIEKLIQEKGLSNILHFDNDVLLFENPDKLIDLFKENYNTFAITAHNSNEVVAGMTFIKNENSLNEINKFLKNEICLDQNILSMKYDGFPNEMRLLSESKLCEYIPILPDTISDSPRYNTNYNLFNSVFDPSSYGQFLGGTFSGNQPGWFGTHQEIGRNISENKIKVIMENKNPYLIFQDQKIKINNLHIHSKKTELFI